MLAQLPILVTSIFFFVLSKLHSNYTNGNKIHENRDQADRPAQAADEPVAIALRRPAGEAGGVCGAGAAAVRDPDPVPELPGVRVPAG